MTNGELMARAEDCGDIRGYKVTFTEPKFPDLTQRVNGFKHYGAAIGCISRLLNQGATNIEVRAVK